MYKLTDPQIKTVAESFGLTYRQVKAVITVEASGSGFNSDGTVKIQFEPAKFYDRTNIRIENGVEKQREEYIAFFAAKAKNEKAAYESTSWGLGQIMGFNYKAAGFASAKDMAEAFKKSEAVQLQGMMAFIKANPAMMTALKANDWAGFARLYNGPKYKSFNYDTRLKAAYDKTPEL